VDHRQALRHTQYAMSIFDAIANSLPDDSAISMGLAEAVDRTAFRKPVLQFASFPVMLDTKQYANALSDSNPNGNLIPLLALRNLIDPLPSFAQSYNPSDKSTEQTYETIIQGAVVKSDYPSITALLSQARQKFEANRFARMDGLPGWWRPVYVVPDDWYDLSKVERFQDLHIDLSDQGGDSAAYAMIGGTAPLQFLTADRRKAGKSLDPQTTIRSLRMKYLLVSLRRPWLNPLLFQYAGWYLSQQASGFCSSGEIDTNPGVLPLLPTGMLLAKDVSIDVAWGDVDQAFLDTADVALSSVSLGPFALRPQAPDSNIQLIAWISSLIPYSPKDSDLRGGSVLVKNGGAFISRFSLAWSQGGRRSTSQSGNFPVLAAESIDIPVDAKSVSVKVEVMTFPPPVETWKTVATLEFDAPIRKCFELTGTTFDVKFAEVGCIG
jgi:hypothetical protein